MHAPHPFHLPHGSPCDASAAEESGWLLIRGYLLLKLRRFKQNCLVFFSTPALNKTADWCMIGEEPVGVITERTYASARKSERIAHELMFSNCLYRVSWHAPFGESIPVRCLETVLKCRGTCSQIHPRGLSARSLQHSFWRGCCGGKRPGEGSRNTSVCSWTMCLLDARSCPGSCLNARAASNAQMGAHPPTPPPASSNGR